MVLAPHWVPLGHQNAFACSSNICFDHTKGIYLSCLVLSSDFLLASGADSITCRAGLGDGGWGGVCAPLSSPKLTTGSDQGRKLCGVDAMWFSFGASGRHTHRPVMAIVGISSMSGSALSKHYNECKYCIHVTMNRMECMPLLPNRAEAIECCPI